MPDLTDAQIRAIVRDELRKAGIKSPEPVDPQAAQRFTISDGREPPNVTTHHRGGPGWAPGQTASCGECLVGFPTRHRPPSLSELMSLTQAGQSIPPADPHALKCSGLVHCVDGGRVNGGQRFVEVCEQCGDRQVRDELSGASR